ncbi:MAG: acetate uptake transporter [Thermoplasmata archaeon]|nr:acetate uptake transporter [Thermoplasmata archaeon]
MTDNNYREVTMNTAEPAALGLFGLALVTLVASSQKMGWTMGFEGMIPWVIFLGAIAQLISSGIEFKRCNTFGATVFGAYGLFWLAIGWTWHLGVPSPEQLGFAVIGYLIFSLYMTYAAGAINKAFFAIMVFIDLLFIFLILQIFFGINGQLAGVAELAVAASAFYTSGAILLESVAGFEVLPFGEPLWKLKKFDI